MKRTWDQGKEWKQLGLVDREVLGPMFREGIRHQEGIGVGGVGVVGVEGEGQRQGTPRCQEALCSQKWLKKTAG